MKICNASGFEEKGGAPKKKLKSLDSSDETTLKHERVTFTTGQYDLPYVESFRDVGLSRSSGRGGEG